MGELFSLRPSLPSFLPFFLSRSVSPTHTHSFSFFLFFFSVAFHCLCHSRMVAQATVRVGIVFGISLV